VGSFSSTAHARQRRIDYLDVAVAVLSITNYDIMVLQNRYSSSPCAPACEAYKQACLNCLLVLPDMFTLHLAPIIPLQPPWSCRCRHSLGGCLRARRASWSRPSRCSARIDISAVVKARASAFPCFFFCTHCRFGTESGWPIGNA